MTTINQNKMNREIDACTVQYLQMIQNAIARMSTSSALFKGFSATIVAGISLITYSKQSVIILLLSFIPIIVFAILDIYYLMLERKMRYLYQLVRTGEHPCDYNMEIIIGKSDYERARIRKRDLVKSPSICIFYPAMIMILVIVLLMEIGGIV